MSAQSRSPVYRFNHVLIEPDQRRLLIRGTATPITARAFDLLLLLVERPGELVTKDECFARVWPGLVVEENNLQQQVSALRKLLGSATIETVPGHGYRITAIIDAAESQAEPPPVMSRPRLPQQPTSFIGREQELREVRELLEANRLLTLVGAGGLGKTRLSLRLAEDIAADFEQVAFVELARLSDPRLVAPAVAAALGIAEQPGRTIVDTLIERLREANALVILDNCEHVLDECGRLANKLLQSASRLRVLATSREPLHIDGEITYPVAALPAADPRRLAAHEVIAQFAATRLFVERAVAAQPAFALTADNAPAVARICHDLDGIPLALELAATRVRMMAIEMIADELSDRFRLLKSRDQTTLPRQQTLRAAIDWSYDLLSPEERATFATLSVFMGGFTLEAAEYVAATGDTGNDGVLELIAGLVEKSLVVMDPSGDRYRMLETIRQYALARLVDAGNEREVRLRHLHYVLRLAGAEEVLDVSAAVSARTNAERDNIIAAFAFCERDEEGVLPSLELLWKLRIWMQSRGQAEFWYRICKGALARASLRDHPKALAGALLAAGGIARMFRRHEEARGWLNDGLALAERAGDPAMVLELSFELGCVCYAEGEHAAARAHWEHNLELARRVGDRFRAIDAMTALAEGFAAEGNLTQAEQLYEQAIVESRIGDYKDGIALNACNLARIAITLGQPEKAFVRMSEALDVWGNRRGPYVVHSFLTLAVDLAALLGEWSRSARYIGAAESHFSVYGFGHDPADEAIFVSFLTRTREALGPDAFEAEVSRGRELGGEAAFAEIVEWVRDR